MRWPESSLPINLLLSVFPRRVGRAFRPGAAAGAGAVAAAAPVPVRLGTCGSCDLSPHMLVGNPPPKPDSVYPRSVMLSRFSVIGIAAHLQVVPG